MQVSAWLEYRRSYLHSLSKWECWELYWYRLFLPSRKAEEATSNLFRTLNLLTMTSLISVIDSWILFGLRYDKSCIWPEITLLSSYPFTYNFLTTSSVIYSCRSDCHEAFFYHLMSQVQTYERKAFLYILRITQLL